MVAIETVEEEDRRVRKTPISEKSLTNSVHKFSEENIEKCFTFSEK